MDIDQRRKREKTLSTPSVGKLVSHTGSKNSTPCDSLHRLHHLPRTIGFTDELGISGAAVREFYSSGWKRPLVLTREDFYHWQFCKAPLCLGQDRNCLVVDEGQVVGVMGVTPRNFLLQEQTFVGAEMTSWLLAENHKGGLAALMMDFLQRSFSVLFGANVSEAALQIYLRKGYTQVYMPRFVRVFSWEVVKPFMRATPLAYKLYNDSRHALAGKDRKFRLETVNPENLTPIVDDFRQTHSFFSRYYPDIQWRYEKHPLYKYQTFVVRPATGEGQGAFLALRVDEDIDGFSMLHILDLFGDTMGMQAALDFVQTLAQESGVAAADFYTTSSAVSACFRQDRWFSILDDSFFSFPHLFHPVESRVPSTTSLVYWSRESSSALHDVGRLYITKQDMDLDRPGPAQLERLKTGGVPLR